MTREFSIDYELLAFFEAEPTVLDAEAPWIYNMLDFTTTRDGLEVLCRFVPSYGKLTTRLVVGGTELVKFELRDVERTSAGLAAARAEGRVGGRRKKLDPGKRHEIAESVLSGRKSAADMARLYNVSQPTVSRIVAHHRSWP